MPPDFVVKSGLNIRPTSCTPIPAPVSATETLTPLSWTSHLTDRTRGPSSPAIDSMAFVIRFRSTCCSWVRSPTTCGSCASARLVTALSAHRLAPLKIHNDNQRPSSRRDQRKSPAKRRTGPAFGYAGGRLTFSLHKAIPPSFTFHKAKVPCPPRARKWPRCRRGQFLPELKFIVVRKEPLFPSGTKTIRGLGNRSARFHHRIRQLCACRGFFPAHIFAAGDPTAWLGRHQPLFLK
jgi:hypothetical protein